MPSWTNVFRSSAPELVARGGHVCFSRVFVVVCVAPAIGPQLGRPREFHQALLAPVRPPLLSPRALPSDVGGFPMVLREPGYGRMAGERLTLVWPTLSRGSRSGGGKDSRGEACFSRLLGCASGAQVRLGDPRVRCQAGPPHLPRQQRNVEICEWARAPDTCGNVPVSRGVARYIHAPVHAGDWREGSGSAGKHRGWWSRLGRRRRSNTHADLASPESVLEENCVWEVVAPSLATCGGPAAC